MTATQKDEDGRRQLTIDEVTEKYNELASKRGLNIAKANFILSRQQERDLKMIYRCDELKLFMDMPMDEKSKYRWKRTPSDPPLIQSLWEANENFRRCAMADDEDLKLKWFDRITRIIEKIQEMRQGAMDRIQSWKVHEEKNNNQIDPSDVYKLAEES